MRVPAILLASILAAPLFAAGPTTTSNDDSCDIAVQPAATLLLPYFEVDFKSPQSTAVTTLFTVANVSNQPQIAHVTLWTDWGFPALTFNIFLTGYDVQGINLYDVFARAVIAPGSTPGTSGTSITTPIPSNPTAGSQPAANTANPRFLSDVTTACANAPGLFTSSLLTDIQQIFTTGIPVSNGYPCSPPPPGTGAADRLGGVHANAVGYATIDVVATCSAKSPTSSDYYSGVLLYDNVLTGDYQQIVPRGAQSYAQGGPLVHIRAIPEGGAAGAAVSSSLPYTFYDRYTVGFPANRTIDRRQPLPSVFAPRYISGGPTGFNASLKIWREGLVGGDAACKDYVRNSAVPIVETVRFDEHENSTVFIPPPILAPPLPSGSPLSFSPSTTAGAFFPPPGPSGDVGGWLYLNLNNGGSTVYSVNVVPPGIPRDFRTNTSTTIGLRQSQNWVITSMFAVPTYATEATAVALGNGCSPSPKVGAQIAPAGNANP
ncbi:MAG TPA: hypothetical protein VI670_26470 [Thermoanaerobaculia bacterium]|jgi:hypothetical protein